MLFNPLSLRWFRRCPFSSLSTFIDLPLSIFPSLLPSPLLFLFSYGEKRVAADNPLLPCLILIAFTGSRLDQYTPTAAFHRCCRASTLSLSLSLSTDLNYPKGCFDEGFSIFSFHPLLPSPRPSPVQAGNLAYFRTARPESPRPPRARSIWFIASTRYVFLYIFSLFFFWRYISQSHSVVRLSLLWKYMEFYLFIYFFFEFFFKFRRDESFLYFYNF